MAGVGAGGGEDRRDLGRQLLPLEPVGEAAEQALGAGGGEQAGPVGDAAGAAGFGEQADELARDRGHSALHNCSTRAIAASVSG